MRIRFLLTLFETLPMKLRIVNFFLFASIGVTCLAAVMAFFNYRYYLKSTDEISKVQSFMLHTTEMLSLMKDGETGMRGYVLTDDTTYLQPYRSCIKGIEFYKMELGSHIQEHEELKHHLPAISRLIDSKLAIIQKTIQLSNIQGQEAAVHFIKTNIGKRTMDSLREEVLCLLKKEEAICQNESNMYKKGLLKMNAIRYCIQAFVILMTIMAIVTLSQKQKKIGALLESLKLANSTLEQKVDERTKELHEANMELTAQNEEISAQAEQINTQNDQLVQLNEEKNKFLGIASHDMKSPLKRVEALLGLVKANPAASVASQKEYFDIAASTVKGMQKLVDQLLDINKIEQGKQEIQKERFDLVKFSQSLLATFESQAQQKDIQLSFESNVPNQAIESDKMVLTQVLENLLSNAIKFSLSHTQVKLSVIADGKSIYLSVQDQGPGIKESELHLLFGRFQKLSNRPTGGESSSGLGLSIVKELAEQLGGSIDCHSVVDQGSTFTVTMPL